MKAASLCDFLMIECMIQEHMVAGSSPLLPLDHTESRRLCILLRTISHCLVNVLTHLYDVLYKLKYDIMTTDSEILFIMRMKVTEIKNL